MNLKTRRWMVFGTGAMGSALVRGWVQAGVLLPKRGFLYDRDFPKARRLAEEVRARAVRRFEEALPRAQMVLLAVKPQNLFDLLAEIRPFVKKGQRFLSIAAGVSLSMLSKALPRGVHWLRVMPNTPARVGFGMSAVARGPGATLQDLQETVALFSAVGQAVAVPEKSLHAVTAVSGSGPAYVFYLMEALEKAAVALKLPANIARRLVVQTVLGAAHLSEVEKKSFEALRLQVTSKGGTTQAAIRVLQRKHMVPIFRRAVFAAEKRSRELEKLWRKT